MTIAFIGIGVMGISMARNLMKQGHSLRVYTRTAPKPRRWSARARNSLTISATVCRARKP